MQAQLPQLLLQYPGTCGLPIVTGAWHAHEREREREEGGEIVRDRQRDKKRVVLSLIHI